jgi:hypothetical protein
MIKTIQLKTLAWILLVISLLYIIGDLGLLNFSLPVAFYWVLGILCLLYILFERKL